MEFVPSPPKNKSYAQAWKDKMSSGGFNISTPFSMAAEEQMGLVPSPWSTSSMMADPRPNGRSVFDARFCDSPMGRARAREGIIWDPRAIVSPFGTTGSKGAATIDARTYAADMKDETDAAAASDKKCAAKFNSVEDTCTSELCAACAPQIRQPFCALIRQ